MEVDVDGFGPDEIYSLATVSRETLTRLICLRQVLFDWSDRINLIGPRERGHFWRRHVWDSLQCVPHIPAGAYILDIGSGGGFPALPLAAHFASVHEGHVTLVETVGKKCAYLRDAIRRMNVPADVIQKRIENTNLDQSVDIITARAFAPLAKLFALAEPWLTQGATGLFHKGEKWQEELTRAQSGWTFQYEVIPSQSGGKGVILRISEVHREGIV